MIDSLILGLSIYTPHISYNQYNHKTPGIYALANDSILLGTVKNSYKRQSVFGGKIFKLSGNTDGAVGLITNYPKHKVLPLVTIGKTFGPVRAMILPGTSIQSSSITFSLEYKIF